MVKSKCFSFVAQRHIYANKKDGHPKGIRLLLLTFY